MAGLISSAEATGIRAALALFRVHTYTRTPVTAGAEDAHGDVTYTRGTPVTGVACKYVADETVRVIRDAGGATIVTVPTLTVAHDDPLDENDLVSNVQNSEGGVLLADTVEVGALISSDGLGPALSKKFMLRAVRVTV